MVLIFVLSIDLRRFGPSTSAYGPSHSSGCLFFCVANLPPELRCVAPHCPLFYPFSTNDWNLSTDILCPIFLSHSWLLVRQNQQLSKCSSTSGSLLMTCWSSSKVLRSLRHHAQKASIESLSLNLLNIYPICIGRTARPSPPLSGHLRPSCHVQALWVCRPWPWYCTLHEVYG